MTTQKSNLIPLQVIPGVQPSTDKTALATPHFTFADKIRFRFGFPQKIGGWNSNQFDMGATIIGFARSMFSCVLSTAIDTVIGTNQKLYALLASQLTNITPLVTATTTISNSFKTDFATLASAPIATVSGSNIITITDAATSFYKTQDIVLLAGASAVNGIGTGNLNTQLVIHTIGSGNYTAITGSIANATGSGGGASVTRSTGRVTVSAPSTNFANGSRVKIASASTFGGINASNLNGEFIIRNATVSAFDIMTAGFATSSVSGGGNTSTTYQGEIAAGNASQFLGQGYGMGFYGVGLYGTALKSTSGISYPRIWFFDRFGANIIMTAGNGTGLYAWAGSTTIAPALISGAPTDINYAFVSNNIVVTFGHQNPNEIFSSDQGNFNQWVASSSNQVFQDTINGAGQLKSHVAVSGVDLIFTDHQTYLFQYIGLPLIWSIQLLENNIGIIGSMARCSVAGTAYWMDYNNFYMWSGGNVAIIPSNTEDYSTILNYVFGNINRSQTSKFYAWYNEQFDEIWFHYASAESNECDQVARLNRTDLTWTPDTFDRCCAEYPNLSLGYPRLISSESILYSHEQGADADGEPMPWTLTTNLRGGDFNRNLAGAASTKNYMITGFVPDSLQTGNINVEVETRRFPQSQSTMYDENYTVTPTTELVTTQLGGRLWQYTLSGDELGQQFQAGQWMEYVSESSGQ